MESRQSTKSVMTRLMGLDEFPKQPEEHQKVISENYLRRVASIGAGKKQSFHDHRSIRKSPERNGDEFRLKQSSGFSLNMKPIQGNIAHSVNDDVHRKSRRRTEFGYLEPFRKVENRFVITDNMRIGLSKPNNGFYSPSPRSEFNKGPNLLDHVGWSVGVEQKERNILGSDERCRQSRAKEPLSGGCLRSRNSKEMGTLDELFQKPIHVPRPRNHEHGYGNRGIKHIDLRKLSKHQAKYEAFRSKWNLQSDKSLNWARLNLRKQNLETFKSIPRFFSRDYHRYTGTRSSIDYMKNPLIFSDNSVTVIENLLMGVENKHSEDDDCSSHATDGSIQQEASLGFLEESSALSLCTRRDLDSQVILEEAYQPSPISVLEPPFSEESIYDLGIQLEILKSDTSETFSEGPGMAVSSDDESEQELSSESTKQNQYFSKLFGVEESRKFSYFVEVITQASLRGKSLADFSTWHSLDRPISLSVFETLEKKYNDKIPCSRSERKLLFDRVNEGLVEILLLCTGVPTWQKSVLRRFSTIGSDEDVIGEDLWKLLVSQEMECRKSSGENLVGSEFGKLKLGDEIIAIGSEIERLLFDELLAELFLLA